MIETYLEYQIASGLFKELLSVRHAIITDLNNRRGDIKLQIELKNVENDLAELSRVISNFRPLILQALESKHKVNFKWLKGPLMQPKEESGKIVSLSTDS